MTLRDGSSVGYCASGKHEVLCESDPKGPQILAACDNGCSDDVKLFDTYDQYQQFDPTFLCLPQVVSLCRCFPVYRRRGGVASVQMRSLAWVCAWLVVLGLGNCGGAAGPAALTGTGGPTAAPAPYTKPKHLWSYDPTAYFSQHDFLDASAFSRDAVVVAKKPPGDSGGSVVVALDPKTGSELWRKDGIGWVVHPPHATTPLWYAPLESIGPYNEAYTHIDRLDPKTGAVLASLTLQRSPSLDFQMRLVWSAQALLAVERDNLVAYDWQTGAPLWRRQIAEEAYLFPPTIVGDRIVFPGDDNIVVSLVDERLLAKVHGACCAITASPDGKHVFARAAEGQSIEIGADNAISRKLAGEVVAASNAYYAIEIVDGKRKRIEVHAYDRTDPVLVLAPTTDDDYYGAIALTERYAFYFHADGAKFSEHEIATGKVETIVDVQSHFVVSPDAVGSSRPHMGTPPRIERPYLFAEEWGVHGYLIGDE